MDQRTEEQIGGSGGGKRETEPKQAEETQGRWGWVERRVWTDRMLQRLAQSQAQTVWYSLWDKVWAEGNLHQACLEVIIKRGSGGVDGQSTQQFQAEWGEQISRLQEELRQGLYRPLPVKRVWIDKLGSTEKRPLGVPAVRDRVVQAALRHVLEPIFERDFAAQSYGFRPGKSAQQALQRVEALLRGGYSWIVDADMKSYFDSIPQKRLLAKVKRRVADGRIIELLEAYLRAGVMESGKGWQPTEAGTPQGAVISPLLANLYLNELDHLMVRSGMEMVRYADDFVVMCRSEAEARQALATIQLWVEEAGLQLHPTKTRVVNAAEAGGFDFLGYHYERYRNGSGKKWPRKKSMLKLRQTIREKTGRLRSDNLETIIAEINPTLKGWYAYFRHSIPSAMAGVDGWVRGRLRSVVRRRRGRRGLSKGRENAELTNQWFAVRGLFSLAEAQRRSLQSRC